MEKVCAPDGVFYMVRSTHSPTIRPLGQGRYVIEDSPYKSLNLPRHYVVLENGVLADNLTWFQLISLVIRKCSSNC